MPRTIITLTDDLMIGTRIVSGLEAVGYAVRVVGDVDAFLAAARVGADAALVPFAARTFDGVAVIRALRADRATAHLPILAFGPHVDTDARTASVAAGATRVVPNGAFFTRMPVLVAALLTGETLAIEDDETPTRQPIPGV